MSTCFKMSWRGDPVSKFGLATFRSDRPSWHGNRERSQVAGGQATRVCPIQSRTLRLSGVAMQPGFFERRSVEELLSQATQWNDLKADEQLRLEVLGWNHDTWDRKRNMSINEFPASANKDFADLEEKQKQAIVGLGIRQFQIPGIWQASETLTGAGAPPNARVLHAGFPRPI
jgi:hypothetical protein